MKKYLESVTVKTGLAIFAMLFGAGNLIFPAKIGVTAGDQLLIGIIAFLLSGVLIPLFGLIGMVFFDGDYKKFFYRVGDVPGKLLIFACMLIIGPLLVMPRIITFSFEILKPFIGSHLLLFSILFGIVIFLCSYKKNSLIDLIGKVLSPLILVSLAGIFAIGYWFKPDVTQFDTSPLKIFKDNLLLGYNTLDLLGTIFFASIVLSILYSTLDRQTTTNKKAMAKIMILSSLMAGGLLALVYTGMALLGSWYGTGLEFMGPGKIFINTLLRVLGSYGSLFISSTVILACLTTIIALASVVSEYIHNEVTNKKISYVTSLSIILAVSVLMAQLELTPLLEYSAPLIYIIYPCLIVLTICNIANKLWNFKPVKIPVLATLIITSYFCVPQVIDLIQNGLPPESQEPQKLVEPQIQQ